MDEDALDGCDLDFGVPHQVTDDGDVAALVLFADVEFDDPASVAERVRAYEELFGAA